LYKLNSVKYNDVTGEFDTINQTAPIGATMTDQDKFWLISYMEAQTLFADDDARLWTADDGRLLDWMLRSPDSDESNVLYSVEENFGSIYGGTIGEDLSSRLRPAFKLALA